MITGQVILGARRWADWAGFFRNGWLQDVGRQMKNLQPAAIYHAPNFELVAPFIDALQPATLVEALDQGLDADRDAVAVRSYRLRDAVSRVDVQEKIRTIEPADSRALGQPLRKPMVAGGLCAPAPGSRIGRGGTVARCEMCAASRDGGAQQPEETINRINLVLML